MPKKAKLPVKRVIKAKKTTKKTFTKKLANLFSKKSKIKINKKTSKKNHQVYFGIGKERTYFIENISMLIGAGLGIVPAIKAIKDEMKSKAMKKIIDKIAFDIENGFPLWEAFKRSNIFDENLISLIRTGEESGRLQENLKLIAKQEEKNRQFKSKLRGAMMYPSLVFTLTVTVGFGIAVFILPRLATVFDQLQIELPKITQVLISLGLYIGENGKTTIPAGIVIIILLLFFIFIYKKTKFIGQSILCNTPVISKLIITLEVARFTYLLGSLLDAGIPIDQALTSLYRSASLYRYKKFYKFLLEHINEGGTFQSGFEKHKHINKLIPKTAQQLIIAGELSGNLSQILLKVSNNYEEKTEITTKNLSVLLEPVLLITVWLGVVAVALGVILPVYNLIGGLNGQGQESHFVRPQEVIDARKNNKENLNLDKNLEIIATSTLEIPVLTVTIRETGVGYLNVREEPKVSGKLLQRVLPSEKYEVLDEQNGWTQILISSLKNEKDEKNNEEVKGWVSSQYVTKNK